jgi:transposase
VEALMRFEAGGTVSQLDEHINTLADYFAEHPPHTVNEARAAIARLRGVERSPTQVREFLQRLGLSRRKVGCLPAKADVEEQAEFQKK